MDINFKCLFSLKICVCGQKIKKEKQPVALPRQRQNTAGVLKEEKLQSFNIFVWKIPMWYHANDKEMKKR